MLKREIPSSKELIPVAGLGSWAKFETDKPAVRSVLKLFVEHDGKLIDTSPMYGNAEQAIGNLTTELRIADKLFYATKVWTTGRDAGVNQMESSMRKMKRSQLDLIQVHNLVDWQTHLKTLKQWKQEGKIRYTGITHYTTSSHDLLEQIIKSEDIDFIQFNYSIRIRNAEQSLLQTARDRGVAVIINEPLEKGSLFKMVKGKPLPAWAAENDMNSWAQFFLKYVIAHPAVTCVIPATRRVDHMEENMGALRGRLPDAKMRGRMARYAENV